LRKFARIAAVCALGVWALGWSASFVSAQQVDVMVGGGTLLSSSPVTATQNQPVISEKGAPYPSVSGDVIFYERFGVNFEGAWKWKEGVYPGDDQTYRPILLDVNALFQPRLSKKFGADIMVGAGAESIRFYPGYGGNCSYASCSNFISSNHFLELISWNTWAEASAITSTTVFSCAPRFTTTTSRTTSNSAPATSCAQEPR
jgi:hypothetical protein